jgi:hypothetical protein
MQLNAPENEETKYSGFALFTVCKDVCHSVFVQDAVLFTVLAYYLGS